MDIKEIALKVADSLRNKIDGISHMQSNQGLIAFAEALIESYKAELLKEVGEPVCYLYKDHEGSYRQAHDLQFKDAHTPVFTSDQLIAAQKPLEEEIERLKAELAKYRDAPCVAYATTNEEDDITMLFFDEDEARKYSGDDEPIKLIVKPGEQ